MDETFIQWLGRTQERRDFLLAYGQTGRPSTAEGRSLDSLKAIEMTDEAARLLSEAETHLTHEKELAMWASRKEHAELNSRERELVERSKVRGVQLIVEACTITHRSCLSRYFNYKGK